MPKHKNNFQRWLSYMKKVPPGELPASYPTPTPADAGKVLSVGPDGALTWVDPRSLPEIKDTDKNKVLVVDSNGSPTWGSVASGEIPLGENESIGIFKE